MTREEAIAVLEESKRQNKIMRDNPTTFWASYQIADGIKNTKRRIDALDAALSALRPVSREQIRRGSWEQNSPNDMADMLLSYSIKARESKSKKELKKVIYELKEEMDLKNYDVTEMEMLEGME